MLRNSDRRYGAIAQGFHWLIVLMFVVMMALGIYMHDLPPNQFKLEIYTYHKSLGVTVLLLMLLRLGWRFANPVPPYPDSMSGPERLAAHASHFLLYGLMIALPVIGILHSNVSGFAVTVWWLVELPPILGQDQSLAEPLGETHELLAFALLGLMVLHAAAAIRHHVILKDDVLRRMLPGRG